MIIQYCIDWCALKGSSAAYRADELCRQLVLLTALIRRNGCVVRSSCVRNELNAWRTAPGVDDELRSVLMSFDEIYNGYSLDVDETGNAACTMPNTMTSWQNLLKATGVYGVWALGFSRGDVRCVVVGDVSESGPFYVQKRLADVVCEADSLSARWMTVQHVVGTRQTSGNNFGSRRDFENFLSSFVATATNSVRIYDPYLLDMFLPVARNVRVKAWRNSFAYLMRWFIGNDRIDEIAVVTSDTKSCCDYRHQNPGNLLRAKEVIDDLLLLPFNARHRSLLISFHIIDGGRAFHDRFLSNGRGCFAIGHGTDICEADEAFNDLERRARMGEQVVGWRNVPSQLDMLLTDFNLFYGCMKNQAPAGVTVFASGRPRDVKHGTAPMYPSGCGACAYSAAEASSRFDLGSYGNCNPVRIENVARNTVLTVAINDFPSGEEDW